MKNSSTPSIFDWMDSGGSADHDYSQKQFINMYEKEIRQRTKMLMNLKYDRRAIHKRIKQNIRWEFELCSLPTFYNSVDKLIDSVFSSHSKNVKHL